MSIICTFCNKPCERDEKVAYAYYCTNHVHKVSFYTDLKNKNVEWRTISFFDKDIAYGLSWFYPNINWPSGPNEFSISSCKSGDVFLTGDIILHLLYHPPNVTPENAQEKLKVWLAIL